MIFFLDIVMGSPHTPLCLEGSSRTTGGLSRGKAYGNVFNFADAEDIAMDNLPVEGKVLLYFSHDNPANINTMDLKPSASFKHKVVPTVKPILKAISGRFSPVKSKFYFTCKFNKFTYYFRI